MWPWTEKKTVIRVYSFLIEAVIIFENLESEGAKKINILRNFPLKSEWGFLAMHINNTKISLIFMVGKCTKYLHGTWSLLNILIFGIKEKLIILSHTHIIHTSYFWLLLQIYPSDWFCGPGSHIAYFTNDYNNDSSPISHWSGWQITPPKTRTIGWDEVVRLVWRGIMYVYTFQGN